MEARRKAKEAELTSGVDEATANETHKRVVKRLQICLTNVALTLTHTHSHPIHVQCAYFCWTLVLTSFGQWLLEFKVIDNKMHSCCCGTPSPRAIRNFILSL